MPNKVESFGRCRRLGRFKLEAFEVQARTPAVTRIMGACAILRAEILAAEDAFEYFASSRHFGPLENGARVPEYCWIFGDDGSLTAMPVGTAYYPWRQIRGQIVMTLPRTALDPDPIDAARRAFGEG